MTARSSSDPRQLQELLGINMASVFIAIWTLTGTIAIAFSFAWKLALVSFCVAVPILLGTGYWRLSRSRMRFAIGSASLPEVVSRMLMYYGGRLLLTGEYSLQSFFVCFMSVLNAGETTGRALSFGPNVTQVTGAANRILSLRNSQMKDDPAAAGKLFKSGDNGMKIELENITFKYPTRYVPVFKGLSLTIEKGHFYELDHGRILSNGQDNATKNVYAYRSHLSLVAQDSSLVQGTIRENILLGVDESAVTDEEFYQACRQASIHDFIVSLPEERQRVSIARALVRDPDILLLDEATSALDSESEKQVQAAFERAGKGRTMLAVAHRLATVRNAHVIFVLGEGELLERGTHKELLAKRGMYWQMVGLIMASPRL
ncbi:hypothetical protein NHJ13734_009384 [Beauveria thailandica]